MKFEIVSKYADADLSLPARKTQASAGYDFQVAEDIVIPSYENIINKFKRVTSQCVSVEQICLKDMERVTKDFRLRPTLVPTGIKCEMPKDMYLELSVRSSCPLKHWLILANGVGIIDADYYNNPDNEGHIFFQIINLSPFDIVLHKGDTIGQGVFHKYYTVDDDAAEGERTGGFGSTSNNYVVDKITSYEVYNKGEKIGEWPIDEKIIDAFNNTGFSYKIPTEELNKINL